MMRFIINLRGDIVKCQGTGKPFLQRQEFHITRQVLIVNRAFRPKVDFTSNKILLNRAVLKVIQLHLTKTKHLVKRNIIL